MLESLLCQGVKGIRGYRLRKLALGFELSVTIKPAKYVCKLVLQSGKTLDLAVADSAQFGAIASLLAVTGKVLFDPVSQTLKKQLP